MFILFFFFLALKLENTKLNEKISEFKFVLDQNSAFIQKLKKENDSKSVLILQLQNGLAKGVETNLCNAI